MQCVTKASSQKRPVIWAEFHNSIGEGHSSKLVADASVTWDSMHCNIEQGKRSEIGHPDPSRVW